ncbi:VCBS repeat-containing protein [Portibacter lacus]|nr:VCBS repeat-containing protein [Portibacter lacus]
MTRLLLSMILCALSFGLYTSCSKEKVSFDSNDEKLFTSIPSSHSGITFSNPVIQTRENNHMINVEFISGAGVAIGDINGDGLPDIFLTGNQVRDRLYLNQGDLKFKDISDKAGIVNNKIWSSGATLVDIDRDGDLDIYVCRNVYLEDEKSANQLYINNGDLTFTDQASEFGLADRGFSMQAIFFDYNKDKLLDMYLVNQPPSIPGQGGELNKSMGANPLFSDKLYKNTGNNKFVDVSDEAGVRNFAFGLSVSVGDLNQDSWPDLYVANDFDVPDHLYINQKDGTFKDEVWNGTKHISNFSMGSDIADYDNDGLLDIMVLDMMPENHKRIKTHMGAMQPETFWSLVESGGHYQYMFNTLQRNNGNSTFSDLAQLAGVSNTDWSWAPLFADFDQDGNKDIFITNGVMSNNRLSDLTSVYDRKLDSLNQIAEKTGRDPQSMIDVMEFVNLAPKDKMANYIYKNNGDLTFTNKIKEWGMEEPTLSNGAAYADLDLDGDLDLVINNIDDEVSLYRNNASEKELGNFIAFNIDPGVKDHPYGTRVSLYRNDSLWQMVELANGRGYLSKSDDKIHFGVGDKNLIEKVVVDWLDGRQSILTNLETNRTHAININSGKVASNPNVKKWNPIFRDVSKDLQLNAVMHKENEYDDYVKEILLPHKMSQFGPFVAVGDINGDQREDFFLGGAAGSAGKLFLQNTSGTFDEVASGPWIADANSEDMGVAFVDFDGDGDLDIFVASGGNEFDVDDPLLQDRLYENQGSLRFTRTKGILPNYRVSSSCVEVSDFDKDGDLDLFVGGRLVPGKYPHPANSILLENKKGKYVDATNTLAPDFENLGMVTSAKWADINNDGLDDLLVVGEWMPVTMFIQTKENGFQKEIAQGLEESVGWFYSVDAEDMDGDGDLDIVAGNLGLNYKYKATVDEPFEVHSMDFDGNGSLDIVLSYYEHGELYPVRGRSCSSQQIPELSEKFPTYEDFGVSNLRDVYGENLDKALNLKAQTFASLYIENLGDLTFNAKPLPNQVQISSINDILIKDFDNDGHNDLLLAGNLFTSEIETTRNDAGIGMFLLGDGRGNFIPQSVNQSGFFAPLDVKNMQFLKGVNQELILIANNDERLQVIEYDTPNN